MSTEIGDALTVTRSRRVRGGKGAMVPEAEVRTYYDMPVIRAPVWTWEIPWYLFAGGMAGASALLAPVAEASGSPRVAKVARRVGALGTLVSPALLISDLGRPERFHHMLRVIKPTSPMSVGTWILTVFGPAQIGSTLLAELGWLPRLRRLASGVATVLGPAMATYTAVLVEATAVPIWHEARQELPFVFAGGAATSAGAAVSLFVGGDEGAPARRLALGGAILEFAAADVMRRRLGELAEPYEKGAAGTLRKAAGVLSAVGVGLLTVGGRRRPAARVLGSAALLAGAATERWAVFKAGFASAEDPKYVVGPQRRRADEQQAPG